MRVHWIIPTRVAPGSGGISTIAFVASELADRGHDVTISVSHELYDPAEVQGVLCEHYDMHGVTVVAIPDIPDAIDLAIATEWRTALPVKELEAVHKAYFVQDFEPWFMPMGFDQIQARLSYTYGFTCITISRWVVHKLYRELGLKAAPVDYGTDTSVFHPLPVSADASEKAKTVCALYQPIGKPRRCAPLLLEAMKIVCAIDPEVQVYYFGGGAAGQDIPGYPGKVLGMLPVTECNELFNRSAVGIAFSGTNTSRAPFDMMAAGLPVVDMHVPTNLYDSIEGPELLAWPTPEDVAGAVLELLSDESRREAMGRAGVKAMAERTRVWETKYAADLFESVGLGEELVTPSWDDDRDGKWEPGVITPNMIYTAEPYRANEEVASVARALREEDMRRKASAVQVEVPPETEAPSASLRSRLLGKVSRLRR